MEFYEVIFLINMAILMGIIGVKIYNLMSSGGFYSLKWSFLLFGAYIMAWGFSLIIMLLSPEEMFYHLAFTIETWLMAINVITLPIEILMSLGIKVSEAAQTFKKAL